MYCLDASVITNSFIEKEKFHEYSKQLMEKIRDEHVIVFLPEICMAEVASAISRGINRADIALSFAEELRKTPNFIFIPIDSTISNLAATLAAKNKLRGCDAIYTAVSQQFNVKLITLDEVQREKSKGVVEVLTPMEEIGK
ncbi:MAG: type II toxin-antitoxin system VapC family toxin [Thermoplasmatales archaeon]|nr:type II toxin-antitoxin system VapC family toxin [Thermoplasmatales archaeon]